MHAKNGGIKLAMANKWPECREADWRTKKSDPEKLGTYSFATVTVKRGRKLTIVNAYT